MKKHTTILQGLMSLLFLSIGGVQIFAQVGMFEAARQRGQAEPINPNSLFSMVLLDQYSNNLRHDITVNFILSNNDTVHIDTQGGFFSIDLKDMVGPEEVFMVQVPNQSYGVTYLKASFLYSLSEAQNVQEKITVVYRDDIRKQIKVEIEKQGCLEISHPLPSVRGPRTEVQPLFVAKTPDQKAKAKADRAVRKGIHQIDPLQ